MRTQRMNASQAVNLARKCGWRMSDYRDDCRTGWSMSFHKPDIAAVWVRFSPAGRLTKVSATDFVTGVHMEPARDKGTRLSHYLTEGIN